MDQDLQIFTSTVIAVFLEASPFLMLGSLLSAVFEIYVPSDTLARYLPKGRIAGLLYGLGAGMLLPTCECGVVSIARRLLIKGVPSQVAITYMLSAPVINPLVLLSTYIAFRGEIWMVLARIVLVVVCAATLGFGLSGVDPLLLLREGKHLKGFPDSGSRRMPHLEETVSPRVLLPMAPEAACGCSCGSTTPHSSRLAAVFTHTASEFLEMGKYLLLGACAVGVFNILPAYDFLYRFMNSTPMAIAGMMLLAMVLSICSEADAFVAASFSTFHSVAQLAFVVIGPMVDVKLLLMYSAVFHRRVTLLLVVVPTLLTYLLCALLTMLMG